MLDKNFENLFQNFQGCFTVQLSRFQVFIRPFYTDISLSVLLTCCLRQRYISYHFCFSLSRTFFILFFEVFQKNKILEIFSISCFRTSKKLFAFTLCFLSLFATAICILQHLFDIVKNFFHLISSFSNETKLLFVVQSLNRDNK